MSVKSTIKGMRKKWDECSRKRKSAVAASFCAVLVLGIGVAVVMSSGVLTARPSQSMSKQTDKRETSVKSLTQASDTPQAQQASDTPQAQASDGESADENQPSQTPAMNGQQHNQGKGQQNEKAALQADGPAPKLAEPDHDESQVSPAPVQVFSQQAAQMVHKQHESKHETHLQPQHQPAKPPVKKNGHWETVVDKPAWDESIYETVTDYKTVSYHVYNYDGYRERIGSFTNHDHGKELALAGKPANYHVESVKEPIGSHKEHVGTKHHEAITRQV